MAPPGDGWFWLLNRHSGKALDVLGASTADGADVVQWADQRLLTGSGVAANNGTKATPALSADLFGDWREEVVWRTADSRALRIYATTAPTDRRITTLMHDPEYRMAVAWQIVAYNQPPHPSFYLGDGMATPPRPAIYVR